MSFINTIADCMRPLSALPVVVLVALSVSLLVLVNGALQYFVFVPMRQRRSTFRCTVHLQVNRMLTDAERNFLVEQLKTRRVLYQKNYFGGPCVVVSRESSLKHVYSWAALLEQQLITISSCHQEKLSVSIWLCHLGTKPEFDLPCDPKSIEARMAGDSLSLDPQRTSRKKPMRHLDEEMFEWVLEIVGETEKHTTSLIPAGQTAPRKRRRIYANGEDNLPFEYLRQANTSKIANLVRQHVQDYDL